LNLQTPRNYFSLPKLNLQKHIAVKQKATTAPTTEDPLPPHLQPGSEVEISSNDSDFRGSWFTGTIINRASQSS
ncbi:hypothetical protein CCACVL1_09692, partial [Corchorus capsularis]